MSSDFFAIETLDGAHTYEVPNGKTAGVQFKIQNNNRKSDTQGYLRKVQTGKYRVQAKVTFVDTKTRIEEYILPMLIYPDSVKCTFDRKIPTRNLYTGTFVLEDWTLEQEFGDDDDQEITIVLTEVVGR